MIVHSFYVIVRKRNPQDGSKEVHDYCNRDFSGRAPGFRLYCTIVSDRERVVVFGTVSSIFRLSANHLRPWFMSLERTLWFRLVVTTEGVHFFILSCIPCSCASTSVRRKWNNIGALQLNLKTGRPDYYWSKLLGYSLTVMTLSSCHAHCHLSPFCTQTIALLTECRN